MAEAAALTKTELLAGKIVQEIARKVDQVPEEYLHKNSIPDAIDAPDLWKGNLLIDFTLLSSSSASELAKLRSALSQWGCFQVKNHGIDNSILEGVIEATKQFFSLPLGEKLECSAPDDMVQGYGSDVPYTGRTGTPTNWNDRLLLSLYPKETLQLQCRPKKPGNFRQVIDKYSKRLTDEVICKAMAKSLNLEENFLNFKKQGPKLARFNIYPGCPCPERVIGTKGHSDGTTITHLLPENNLEGLHIHTVH